MIFINHEDELVWNNKWQTLYFYDAFLPFNLKTIYMLNNIEKKFLFVAIFAINIEFFKTLCKRFNINTIPTILIMKNGKENKRIEGLVPSQEFVTIFDDICII
jgi:thioredoxin-related protein